MTLLSLPLGGSYRAATVGDFFWSSPAFAREVAAKPTEGFFDHPHLPPLHKPHFHETIHYHTQRSTPMPVITAPRTPDVMLEMNTTPLIDVLLVLLVMLIITIPLQTHAVRVDLPGGPATIIVHPLKNLLTVDDAGTLRWNDQAVSRAQLEGLLDASAAAPDMPELHLRPSPQAHYHVVDEVLAMTKRAHLTRVGFVGNEAYGKF